LYETNATRVYLVRHERRDPLAPAWRSALVDQLRAASRSGPVAVVLDLGTSRGVDPSIASFWMGFLEDRLADVAVVAVVTSAPSLRLATLAFSAVVSLRHLPVEVQYHARTEAAITWAAQALSRAAAARRLARMAQA
jgi:hypothetical protein